VTLASGAAAVDAERRAVHFGPSNGPVPLGETIAYTFRDGLHSPVVLSEEITLYRVYGGSAARLGSYWTRTPPTGPLQARRDFALNPIWGNTAEHVSTIKVPAGTTIYERATPQSMSQQSRFPQEQRSMRAMPLGGANWLVVAAKSIFRKSIAIGWTVRSLQ
jgi:hypothetical protein